jgi:hypothetical protein
LTFGGVDHRRIKSPLARLLGGFLGCVLRRIEIVMLMRRSPRILNGGGVGALRPPPIRIICP